jgi:hypothetical protein
MTGLAWYYLLAAMLNAAAAAYVAYMEMVSEGASRAGWRPGRDGCPDWLVVAFGTLYGLATLTILGRPWSGPRRSGSPTPSAPWPTRWWPSPRGPTRPTFAEVHAAGHGRAARYGGPSLDDHLPAVGLGGR